MPKMWNQSEGTSEAKAGKPSLEAGVCPADHREPPEGSGQWHGAGRSVVRKIHSGPAVWRVDLRRTRWEAGGPISRLVQDSGRERRASARAAMVDGQKGAQEK